MKLIADLHTHTVASTHAYSTVTENTAQAEKQGLKIMAVTDHAPQIDDAPHIWHHQNLSTLPRIINNVFVLRGIEANIIDNSGNVDIDIEKGLMKKMDWIIASYHWGSGTKSEFTESYIKALENPDISCLGHTDSKRFPYDVKEVCKACAHFGKAMELNVARIRDISKKDAYDFYRNLLSVCAEEKAFVVVNTDSHFWNTIGDFTPALKLIEEVGFPQELLLNADEDRLKEFVNRKKEYDIFDV